MKLRTRLAAAALAVALLLPASAAAGETDTAARQADLDFLYTTLQEVHPDIFTAHTPAEFETRISQIETTLSTRDELFFALDLQSLVAMVGDSHTTASLSGIAPALSVYPFSIDWMEGRWVLSLTVAEHTALLGQTVTAIGGVPMAEVGQRLSTLISADNVPALRKGIPQMVNYMQVLTYLGIAQTDAPLTLTVADSDGRARDFSVAALSPEQLQALDRSTLVSLSTQRQGTSPTDFQKRYYFSLPLDERTYYIQYNTCQEDPSLPMEDFAATVAADLAAGRYDQLLIDLRNNGGGSDGVLFPILSMLPDLLRDGVQVYGLIGESTFSSACINAVEIQDAGGLLAGSLSSASVNHFGEITSFALPNSGMQVWHSNNYFDLNTLLEARQVYGPGVPLTPDVVVEQTVADFLAGRDTVVEELLENGKGYTAPALPDAPLTRGRLAGLLYERAGADATGLAHAFGDLFPLSWYLDGINWCASVGVVSGNADGSFAATRPITVQEAALMLTRYAEHAGRTPQKARTDVPGWGTQPDAWAAEAVTTLWHWGGLEEGFSPTATLTRAQGQALVDLVGGETP